MSRPAGQRGRRIRAARRDGDERISADLAQERTTNSWEVVTGMARRLPRVYHAAAGPVGLRTLTSGELVAQSSSGTATSATSRSMRSSRRQQTLWMATGWWSPQAGRRRPIEFAAVRQAPLHSAVPSSRRPAPWRRAVIHAISLDRDRRTSGRDRSAVRSAMARAREAGVTSIAFPALGSGSAGSPSRRAPDHGRDRSRRAAGEPAITHVIFAFAARPPIGIRQALGVRPCDARRGAA